MPEIIAQIITPLLEMLVLAVMYYYVFLFLRGTRGWQMLVAFVVALLVLQFVTEFFHLTTLNWVLAKFTAYIAIAFIVIFQPEIRRALAELGKQHVFAGTQRERGLCDHLVQATLMLAERKIGALIAVEQEIGMRTIQETGTPLDARVTPELLSTIFYPGTPLHDGGVLVRENRVVAAGCLFPLSQRIELGRSLGTRHRAAIGLTEETDAVVLVVSEETGTISIAYRGRLLRPLDEDKLRRILTRIMLRSRKGKSRISRVQELLDLSPDGVAKTEEISSEQGGADVI